jgi:hypothetical protein
MFSACGWEKKRKRDVIRGKSKEKDRHLALIIFFPLS